MHTKRTAPVLLSALAFIIIGIPVVANPQGTPGVFVDTGQSLAIISSVSVKLGDLDGDGDLDAFVVNTIRSANRVWFNDGTGVFADSGQSLGLADSAHVSLGDVDGDGDLDAYVANTRGQDNFVWLNDGSGVFTDSGQRFGGFFSSFVKLADLDGDTDLDAFVASEGQANKVYLNNGSGVFADSGQLLGNSQSGGFDLGDIDGDGDLDAFVPNAQQLNRVWVNDGTGQFTDSGQSVGGGQSFQAVLADLDNDGDLDAMIANAFVERNEVWLNDGSGVFTDSGQRLGGLSSRSIGLGDLDGDGDFDAFVANTDGQPNRVFLNQTDPNPLPVADAGGPYTFAGPAGTNVTLDGRSSHDPDGDSITFLWEAKGIVFDDETSPTPAGFFPLGTTTVTLTVSDGALIAKDRATVIVTDPFPPGDPGVFVDSSGQHLGNLPSVSVKLGDLDGDGDLDAFVVNTIRRPNRVWFNDGTGVFADSGQSLGLADSAHVSLGDVDGDGDLDAFVVNASMMPDVVYINDGTGHFTAGQSLGNSDGRGGDLGDVDGDGDLDAYVANTRGQNNFVWLNDGSGVFTDSGQRFGGFFSSFVKLADLDGDTDLDAFVASEGQANKVYLNNGSGVFADSGQLLGYSQSNGFDLGDIDGDGDLDAFVTNSTNFLGGQFNRIWVNDGTGQFTDSGQSVGGGQSFQAVLADLDNDGDLDAMIANAFVERNEVWLNDGSGVFTDSGQRLGGLSSRSIGLGDLDGDGDLDAFVANTDFQPNRVDLNQTDTVLNTPPSCNPSGAGIFEIGSTVTLGGTVSDNEGDLVTFQWRKDGVDIPSFSGAVLTLEGGEPVTLPTFDISTLDLGLRTFVFELVIDDGNILDPVVCELVVEVVDTGPPTLAPVLDHGMLWPPNHKMVTCTVQANAADNSGVAPLLAVTVTSSEPDNGLGDGDTPNDIQNLSVNQAAGTITVDLRAERAGVGSGRVYTITITATDGSGNSSMTSLTVIVPRSKGHGGN